MKYKIDFSAPISMCAPAVTGAMIPTSPASKFYAWLPSTWPATPTSIDSAFTETLQTIFRDAALGEIKNVISDIQAQNGDLQHRGHVVGIAIMCALDSIASYGYRGHHTAKFIRAHFPPEFHPFADDIYKLYRISLIHQWNLFEATLYPDHTPIRNDSGTIAFGLLSFFDALVSGTEDYLDQLSTEPALQQNTLNRYEELRKSARP
jgi:hypothetical protein